MTQEKGTHLKRKEKGFWILEKKKNWWVNNLSSYTLIIINRTLAIQAILETPLKSLKVYFLWLLRYRCPFWRNKWCLTERRARAHPTSDYFIWVQDRLGQGGNRGDRLKNVFIWIDGKFRMCGKTTWAKCVRLSFCRQKPWFTAVSSSANGF